MPNIITDFALFNQDITIIVRITIAEEHNKANTGPFQREQSFFHAATGNRAAAD